MATRVVKKLPKRGAKGASPAPASRPAASSALDGPGSAPLAPLGAVTAGGIEIRVMAVRHETVGRSTATVGPRPVRKEPAPSVPRGAANLQATTEPAKVEARAGALKEGGATRQVVPKAHLVPAIQGRRQRPQETAIPSSMGTRGRDIAGVIGASPGVLAVLGALPVRARRVDGPFGPEATLALGLRRLGRATAPASGQIVGEVTRPITGDGRVTRPRHELRTAAAAVTGAEALVGVEGVAPAPGKSERPQAVRALDATYPADAANTGVLRAQVGPASRAAETEVVAVGPPTVAQAEAAASHRALALHGEGVTSGRRVQGPGRPPVVAMAAALRVPVTSAVAGTAGVPTADPGAVRSPPLDPPGHAPGRPSGVETVLEGPTLEG